MNTAEKTINFLQQLCDLEQSPIQAIGTQQCANLSVNRVTLARSLLARALQYDAPNPEAAAILHKLAADKNDLVRMEAVDALRAFSDTQTYCVLLQALHDPKPLVRSYAASSLSLVGQRLQTVSDTKVVLSTGVSKERQISAKIGYYQGLYRLGDEQALHALIACFRSKRYQNQCAVLNVLWESLNAENAPFILQFLQTVDFDTYPVAVSDTAHRLLLHIQTIKASEEQA